ncbi:glutaredoxin family protein [Solimonas sp. K1W22B-7]|uniref:glutaredoxin family protein n=1 Tax=Solimonas sp. K1W22B-7 TaxID=2303331 RepID=UPI000E332637|nr:glutaredoxin family protein [Solimonas sp. K1W22B-7]AXQ30224.1 glutaredoxin family protein [Solimonas sp. K1W22B-7]
MPAPGRTRLLLLSRPGCCLCDELEEDLLAEFGPGRFELERADVDSRPDWKQAYGLRIPVLLGESGQVLSEGRFDPERVGAALGASGAL